MKKYLLPVLSAVFLVLVILLMIGKNIESKNNKLDSSDKTSSPILPTPSTTPSVVVVAPEIIPKEKSILFKDKENSFKIWYPETAIISYSEVVNNLTRVSLATTSFFGTNLHEAYVEIGIDANPLDSNQVNKCLQPKDWEKSQGVITIGQKEFSSFVGNDAGAGNLYESQTYRRVQDGHCYEIAEVLHSSNIGNYEPGTIKEFDKKYFSAVLDKIATSFEF